MILFEARVSSSVRLFVSSPRRSPALTPLEASEIPELQRNVGDDRDALDSELWRRGPSSSTVAPSEFNETSKSSSWQSVSKNA
eukprot:1305066-Pyramimonas_sp.AAC.1